MFENILICWTRIPNSGIIHMDHINQENCTRVFFPPKGIKNWSSFSLHFVGHKRHRWFRDHVAQCPHLCSNATPGVVRRGSKAKHGNLEPSRPEAHEHISSNPNRKREGHNGHNPNFANSISKYIKCQMMSNDVKCHWRFFFTCHKVCFTQQMHTWDLWRTVVMALSLRCYSPWNYPQDGHSALESV